MMRMGPESLLVQSSVDARIDLAAFARAEFYTEDPRVLEREVRSQLEREIRGPSLLDRARAWLHPDRAAPTAAEPARRAEVPWEAPAVVPDACLAGRTLAAMPASLAPLHPQR
jgi:hypothetical protein